MSDHIHITIHEKHMTFRFGDRTGGVPDTTVSSLQNILKLAKDNNIESFEIHRA